MADTSYLESLQNGVGMDPNDHSSMSGSIIWTTGVLMFAVFVFALARAAVRLRNHPVQPYSRGDQARIIGWDDCKLLILYPQQRSLQFPVGFGYASLLYGSAYLSDLFVGNVLT